LQNKYEEYVLKVDADVINDLLIRQRKNPLSYQSICWKPLPKNRNHYVTHQETTLEMLKDEHLDHKHTNDYYLSQEEQQLEEQRREVEEKKIPRGLNNYKLPT
jgi:hypothetical protein